MLLGIIELTLLKSKTLFSSFCMVGNNPSDSSDSSLVAKQKFNLQGKKVTENKLKSSDYEFTILRKCHTRKCQNEFQFCNTSKQKLLW